MEKRSISFSPPDITELEIAEVSNALRSGWITTGPRTKLLERRIAAYIDTGRTDVDCTSDEAIQKFGEKVVCLNSATAAEELNLKILGITEGDEVIVPAYTYTATASAAIHCGASVKFVDIQLNGALETRCPEMDYEALEKAITPKTKAVVLVDLGGVVCDYDRVFDIVERKKALFTPVESDGTPLSDISSKIQNGLGRVAVIADCAHSLGARRIVNFSGAGKLSSPTMRYTGRIADFSSFSFHAVKNFTTAEGGAATWCLSKSVYDQGIDDGELYRFYQLLSLHGQNKDALAKTKVGAWEYDIIGSWYKCNMTDVVAAIGLAQLDRYPMLLSRRKKVVEIYDRACGELGLEHLNHHVDGMDSSNHLYLIRIPNISEEKRNAVIIRLSEFGIATNVHYKPLPMMTAYKGISDGIEQYPNSYDYYKNLISLPLHTLLTDDDVTYIVDTLNAVLKEMNLC